MALFSLNSEQKKTARTILLILAIVVLLLVGFFAGRGYQKTQPSPSEQYLKEQLVQYEQEIADWQTRFKVLHAKEMELEQNVVTLEDKLKSIKDYYDQKIITVNSYSNAELEQFFADRYPD